MKGKDQKIWSDLSHGTTGLDPLEAIKVSNDSMVCSLHLDPDKPVPALEQILELLTDRGITCGIDKNAIIELSRMSRAPRETVIARGTQPVKGQPADIRRCYRLPEEWDSDDNVQKNQPLQYVKKNELLAVKLRNTSGQAGIDVFGLPVDPEPGDDVSFMAGKNVQQRFFPDKIEFSALCDGLIKHGENRVDIESLFIVDHDVDEESGTIEFPGNILVKGNVLQGGSINCRGSLTIEGNVNGGKISVHDHLIINGKVDHHSEIQCEHDVELKKVADSHLLIGGNLNIGDTLMDSRVECKGGITVQNPSGCIAGGKITVTERIDTPFLGSPRTKETTVNFQADQSGNATDLTTRAVQRIDSEITKMNKQIQETRKATRSTPDKMSAWKMKTLEKQLFRLNQQRREYEKRMDSTLYTQKTTSERARRIIVRKRVYPVVKLQSDNARFIVDHSLDSVEFFLSTETGEWQVTGLDGKR